MGKDNQKTRDKVIAAITAPLGFFVLGLLIVEAFLANVLIFAKLESPDKMSCVWLGVGLFALVSVMVFFLVWFKPENLTFDKEAHLIDRGKAPYGTESKTAKKNLIPTQTTAQQ